MCIQKFKRDIQKLEQKYNLPNLLNDVSKQIKSKKAFAHSSDSMLFIFKPMHIDGVKTLFAWVGIHHNNDLLSSDIKEIERIANFCGCSAVRFESKRKGFLRYAPKFGYANIGKRLDFYIFEKRV